MHEGGQVLAGCFVEYDAVPAGQVRIENYVAGRTHLEVLEEPLDYTLIRKFLTNVSHELEVACVLFGSAE
jgi:hypothetical protein